MPLRAFIDSDKDEKEREAIIAAVLMPLRAFIDSDCGFVSSFFCCFIAFFRKFCLHFTSNLLLFQAFAANFSPLPTILIFVAYPPPYSTKKTPILRGGYA